MKSEKYIHNYSLERLFELGKPVQPDNISNYYIDKSIIYKGSYKLAIESFRTKDCDFDSRSNWVTFSNTLKKTTRNNDLLDYLRKYTETRNQVVHHGSWEKGESEFISSHYVSTLNSWKTEINVRNKAELYDSKSISNLLREWLEESNKPEEYNNKWVSYFSLDDGLYEHTPILELNDSFAVKRSEEKSRSESFALNKQEREFLRELLYKLTIAQGGYLKRLKEAKSSSATNRKKIFRKIIRFRFKNLDDVPLRLAC